MSVARAVQEMHERCAIYTSSAAAAKLLDLIGWTKKADLSTSTLLEPCVGEGAILLEAIRRLLASFRVRGLPLTLRALEGRIKGYEFHPGTAATARRNVQVMLLNEGLDWQRAGRLAGAWVHEADFLLRKSGSATHVAANPPYLRWGKLPPGLATKYRRVLRPIATRGDVAVAFLDKMLEWARNGGRVAALISDRWMFAQYGSEFVADSKARGWSLEVIDDRPANPFVRDVGAYSAIVRMTHGRVKPSDKALGSRAAARRLHQDLVAKHGSLESAGCIVRVGPALGCGRTFLIDEAEAKNIESDLVWPYVGREDLRDGTTKASALRVAVPYDREGSLININDWAGFRQWVQQHETKLKGRSHFKGTDSWWRTIDAIGPQWRVGPKLLLPELCKEPMVSLDSTAALPAHSLYAIWPGEWPPEALQAVLNGGLCRLLRAQRPLC